MHQNSTFNPKSYEYSPRISHKNTDNNYIKPKARDSLPPTYQQQLDNSLQSIRTTKQYTRQTTQNYNKYNNKIYQNKIQISPKGNQPKYNNFPASQGVKNMQYTNSIKNQDDDASSIRFFQPVLSKNQSNHSNSAKLVTNNKLNLSYASSSANFSPSNVNIPQIGSQRKNFPKTQNAQYKNQTTAELLSSIKKSNQLIAEAQNNMKKKQLNGAIFQTQQFQTNNIKKLPRLSQPGFLFQNQHPQIHYNNDDTVSQFRSPHSNKIINSTYDYLKNGFSNPQKKIMEKQSQYNNQGFKKHKQYKDTISTHSTINSVGKQKLRSPKSFTTVIDNHQTKVSDFIKGKELGSGKFGTVNIVTHKKTGFICAMKTIPKNMIRQQNIVNQFTRQIKIQSYLDHPNITKLYGFFDDKQYFYLLLQLGSEGQLYKVLKQKKRFSQNSVVYIMRQLCQAIKYLHSLNIIHRDIKPQNIVMQYGTMKLCDFGWAVHKGGQLRSTFCGTPLYVSPQILQGQMYDQKIDIWSIGILAYELLVGQIPFQITNEMQLIKIIKQQIVFPNNLNISSEAKDFVMKILKRNPDQRLKIGKLLQHPFLQRNVDASQVRF